MSHIEAFFLGMFAIMAAILAAVILGELVDWLVP